MRRILLIALLFISACNKTEDHHYTKQQKAEKLVKDYLILFLKGQRYDKSVKFDTLRVLYKTYEYFDPEGKRLHDIAILFADSALKYDPNDTLLNFIQNPITKSLVLVKANKNKKLFKLYLTKKDSLKTILTIKGKNFRGGIFGYSIEHRFHTINTDGDTLFHRMRFAMDTDFKKVFNANGISDYQVRYKKSK